MKIRLITDSTANINADKKDKFSIVPLKVIFGDKEYTEGVDIDEKRFYEMLIESDDVPTTSQPSPLEFMKAFKEAYDNGETVIAITVASKLSGTYQSACIAASEFPEGSVYVIDSNNVALGTGILAERALELKESGMSAEGIVKIIEEEKDRVRLIALLDTLEYLKKGGRISKTVAFAGGILSIKPVIGVEDGEIKMLGKARGSKKGNNLLVEQIKESGGVDFTKPVLLGYTGLNDDLLKKYIEDSNALWEGNVEKLPQCIVGSVVGTHAGPGAVAVAYFANK